MTNNNSPKSGTQFDSGSIFREQGQIAEHASWLMSAIALLLRLLKWILDDRSACRGGQAEETGAMGWELDLGLVNPSESTRRLSYSNSPGSSSARPTCIATHHLYMYRCTFLTQ